MFSLAFLRLEGMPSLESGHPDIGDFPVYAQNFYNMTHSLTIFFVIFFIIFLMRKKPFYPLAAWAIHIIIDIPTHSLKLFPTPFLWPISGYRFDGISWGNPIIMIPNIILLSTVYGVWLYKKSKKKASLP